MTNQLLPPLIGLFFAYLIVLQYEKDESHKDFPINWYVCIGFLLICEQTHNFRLFSIGISFVIFYYFIFDYLLENIKFRNILLIVTVISGYILALGISNLLSYIMQIPYLPLGEEYALYMLVESLLATICLKGRIL